MPSKATVFLVDDHAQVRRSVCASIKSLEVEVECYATESEFFEAYDETRPGCIILDLHVPQNSGLDALRRLSTRSLRSPVIITAGMTDVATAVRVMKAGAFDFLEKPYRYDQLRDSIQQAIEFDSYQRGQQQQRGEAVSRLQVLSDEEQQILDLIVADASNKEIALQLGISVRTVCTRCASLMAKMNAHSRTELLKIVLVASTPSDVSLPLVRRETAVSPATT